MVSASDFERPFDQAMALRDEGRLDEALAQLVRLEGSGHHPGVLARVIGGLLLFEKEDVQRAIPHLLKAVELLPESERASVNLFHGLMRSGRDDEAFAEMKRYLASNRSEEYERLLADLKQELGPED